MAKKIIGLMYLFTIGAYAEAPKLAILTVPKSGSHLLLKVINQLTHKSCRWCVPENKNIPAIFKNKSQFAACHLPYSSKLAHWFKENGYKVIVNIRDPRDVLNSMGHWFFRDASSNSVHVKKLLTDPSFAWYPDPDLRKSNFHEFFSQFTDWYLYSPENVYISRFENLVGPLGGGNLALQCAAIEELARFIGVPVTKGKAYAIAIHAFGGTATFREGKMHAWRDEFDTEAIVMAKGALGDLLIKWGYEKNIDW